MIQVGMVKKNVIKLVGMIVRVVHLLDFIRMQMADGTDRMDSLHQIQR